MANLAGIVLAVAVVVGQSAEVDSPVFPHLEPLDCFTGEWKATATIPDGTTSSKNLGEIAGNKVVIEMSVRWAPGKCAQIIDVKYQMQDVVKILATGIRAWDQKAKHISENTFTTHKGTWSGKWKKEGETWVHEYEGTNLDGSNVVGKRVITFRSDDLFVLKAMDKLDGEPQPAVEWRFARK